ncbi:DNA alkylation repair protein [Hydrogenophaga sp. PBL-H3]|uniref:DNA alkylation repair protein n=1 Tax=Hydrogenophaga sp. PBL-H3 TaxID=434010 RepID=UPI00131F4C25|nr:DNA alkylation repair protein [Hydrogenophaga sp. PBL-H3]QHE74956.1 DNA alkylation repair protein [Hydrogenophaga sp. PBL-H3]QHE79383.1 DNA alkylation repair protein [Hydrogenophaga sp. PBL-H3]
MEPFKNLINATTVAHAGLHLQRAWSGFDRPRFEALANHGLDALELKARMLQLATAMHATLPADFNAACTVLETSLAPPLPLDATGEPVGLSTAEAATGLSGWVIWSMGEFVARQGQHDVSRSLACLHALTQRSTAEFAIRPFIQQRPEAVWPVLARWANDPSAHVRRLVSEGSRPRLPWGLRLQALVADPAPALPLLRSLQDDPSSYVRRSVANHLNDIAKDHPDLVASWVHDHLIDAPDPRSALLRHASRSLIKAGHAPTLAAWGLASGLKGEATLALSAKRAAVGGEIGLRAVLRSSARKPQLLVVDYAVHHVRANGSTSPKVFKGWKLTLEPGEERTLEKRHSLKPVTTRTLYPGTHRIQVLVNGVALAEAAFDLLP